MSLALFDLDNTLLDGDSDYLWGRFLVDEGIVDGKYYERENQRFFDQYLAGTLDIVAYSRFAFKPLAETPIEELHRLRSNFIEQHIKPLILPKAIDLLSQHRHQGDILIIITSTNRYITEPISTEMGADILMATEPEFKKGRFTGDLLGIPCFQQGKVMRLRAWMKKTGHSLEGSWFYSDSHNDLPLLEIVTHPVAVDADSRLSQHAKAKGWPIISLKN
jgi:HAD superfamily hydrolase (TIGR01490 family)